MTWWSLFILGAASLRGLGVEGTGGSRPRRPATPSLVVDHQLPVAHNEREPSLQGGHLQARYHYGKKTVLHRPHTGGGHDHGWLGILLLGILCDLREERTPSNQPVTEWLATDPGPRCPKQTKVTVSSWTGSWSTHVRDGAGPRSRLPAPSGSGRPRSRCWERTLLFAPASRDRSRVFR